MSRRAMSRRAMSRRVVLVHGAWHGAWCWELVLAGLADAGVEAVAVDLPGHGDDPGPLGDLHADAARVRAELDRGDREVVLVGHSYGGAVITEAGVHPAVTRLVYVCAFALAEGESVATAAAGDAAAAGISHDGRPNLGAGFVRADDDTVTLDPEVARACLYQDCPPALADAAIARLGPQPMVTFGQAPDAVAWRATPATYAVCTEDLAVHPELQRLLARRCADTVEWPTGHSPFLSHPALVVDLLAGLAR